MKTEAIIQLLKEEIQKAEGEGRDVEITILFAKDILRALEAVIR